MVRNPPIGLTDGILSRFPAQAQCRAKSLDIAYRNSVVKAIPE
jgi:hypothetical protein